MKKKYEKTLTELAEHLVTPQRFASGPVIEALGYAATLPSLPDNVYLLPRDNELPGELPPEAA